MTELEEKIEELKRKIVMVCIEPDLVLKVMTRQGVPRRYQTREQAIRVA